MLGDTSKRLAERISELHEDDRVALASIVTALERNKGLREVNANIQEKADDYDRLQKRVKAIDSSKEEFVKLYKIIKGEMEEGKLDKDTDEKVVIHHWAY